MLIIIYHACGHYCYYCFCVLVTYTILHRKINAHFSSSCFCVDIFSLKIYRLWAALMIESLKDETVLSADIEVMIFLSGWKDHCLNVTFHAFICCSSILISGSVCFWTSKICFELPTNYPNSFLSRPSHLLTMQLTPQPSRPQAISFFHYYLYFLFLFFLFCTHQFRLELTSQLWISSLPFSIMQHNQLMQTHPHFFGIILFFILDPTHFISLTYVSYFRSL